MQTLWVLLRQGTQNQNTFIINGKVIIFDRKRVKSSVFIVFFISYTCVCRGLKTSTSVQVDPNNMINWISHKIQLFVTILYIGHLGILAFKQGWINFVLKMQIAICLFYFQWCDKKKTIKYKWNSRENVQPRSCSATLQ